MMRTGTPGSATGEAGTMQAIVQDTWPGATVARSPRWR
jgi:hypothetical protein